MRVEFVQLMQDVIGDLAGASEPVRAQALQPRPGGSRSGPRSPWRARSKKTPGLVDLFNGVQGPNPERRVALDPDRVARLGLTVAEVQAQARSRALRRGRRHRARARPPGADPGPPARQRALPGRRGAAGADHRAGGWLPLDQLGQVRDTGSASELLRENLRPYVAVTGRTSGRSLGSVMRDVRAAVASVPLPAGGHARARRTVREPAGIVPRAARRVGARDRRCAAAARGAVRQLSGPLAILLAVPLGLTGAPAHAGRSGVPFNVSSFMG